MKKLDPNLWQRTMYDELHASTGLDSKPLHVKAKVEAAFILSIAALEPGAKILDVPCGSGRHSVLMADAGYKVTGVDISDACLRLAKRNARKRKNLTLRNGNMNDLAWAKNKFDMVCNLFSSFGYFANDKENFDCLKGMVGALRPGGKLVIQTINREFVLRIFDPARWGEDKAQFWLEATKYDPDTHYVESQKILIPHATQKAFRYYFRMRLYSIPELKKLLRAAGLRNVTVFGAPDGSKADRANSIHPIYIAEK